jgi:putative tributyrin esterase
MALIHIDHVSETIKVNLPLNILVPDPGQMGGTPVRRRKVLYLLHGLSDDASAWQRYSAIETIAASYGLIVVMPSVGRSFYIDQPNGQRYFTYLAEELPRYLEDVFDLAPAREDTFIAGNSMGGYGAMKAAFLYPERFAAAASLSGMLSLEFIKMYPDDARQLEFRYLVGDLDKLSGGEHDPVTWMQKAAGNPGSLPNLYLYVGKQEDVYPLSRLFQAQCQNFGIPVNCHEENGRHEWPFWNAYIQLFLASVIGG